MSGLPSNPSAAVRRRNPHIYLAADAPLKTAAAVLAETQKAPERVRQTDKPLNRLEQSWLAELLKTFRPVQVKVQALRFRLANGAWYKPDFVVLLDGGGLEAWEVKGPKRARWSRRGELTVKFAAAAWPFVRWHLAWKDGGGRWATQRVLP